MKTRKTTPTRRISRTLLAAWAILTLTFFAASASASCFDRAPNASSAIPSGFMAATTTSPATVYTSIVGLWHVTYTTSQNQLFQESFDEWHSDGTELETANVSPIAGNLCIGVWKQVESQIRLHHVGWAFDNAGNLFGPFTVIEVLALGNNGHSYSGTFDFKQYDTGGNLVLEVTGTIKAARIVVN